MKYVILIYRNPKARDVWDGMSATEHAEAFQAYARLDADLTAAGELIVSEALADPDQGKRVTLRSGQPVVSDGPFAEAKEQLAGFYLIDCPNIERAIEWAARVPGVGNLELEVRPVVELGDASA